MATKPTPKASTSQYLAKRYQQQSHFDVAREFCMDGSMAESIDGFNGVNAKLPANMKVNVGEVCLLNLEHSADTERHSAALANRPDKALLGPYKLIAGDKGFSLTETSAEAALTVFSHASQLPAAKHNITATYLPVSGGKGQPLMVVPGAAFDAGFTKTSQETMDGKALPAPGKSRHEIIAEAAKCFTNAQQYIGQCYSDGVEAARSYFAAHPVKKPHSR